MRGRSSSWALEEAPDDRWGQIEAGLLKGPSGLLVIVTGIVIFVVIGRSTQTVAVCPPFSEPPPRITPVSVGPN